MVENKKFDREKAELAVIAFSDKTVTGYLPDAMQKKSPTLATLQKYLQADSRMLIWELIQHTTSAINVGRGIAQDNIAEIIDFIFAEYYFYTFEEIKCFFYFCKIGKFGKVYDRFDMQTICLYFQQFDELRTIQAIAKSQSGISTPCSIGRSLTQKKDNPVQFAVPSEITALIEKLDGKKAIIKPKPLPTFAEYCELPHIIQGYNLALSNKKVIKFKNGKKVFFPDPKTKLSFQQWAEEKYYNLLKIN